MTKPIRFERFDMYSLKHQTGDFLIEAMIGTLITALVSLGTLKITSHVMLTQGEMVRQETIVTVLREQLYTHDPNEPTKNQCTNGTQAAAKNKFTHLGNVTFTPSCPVVNETYSLNGKALAPVALPVVYVSVKVPVASNPSRTDQYEYALGVKQ
ncbi:MAG: hypothetical protein EOO68_32950 [Moraxellaceae bacterium]|nr:MAG: hypothetical protein EOO68_32950 [Moraxellaceae bacterium]